MLTRDSSTLVCFNKLYCLNFHRNGSKPYISPPPTLAMKKDSSFQNSRKQKKPLFPLKLFTNTILIQSAIGVLTLGFIDAGYSGDWSRIGVISKGTEDLLKAAAFLLVPLSLFLIFSLSDKDDEK